MDVDMVFTNIVESLRKEITVDSRIVRVGGIGIFSVLTALGAFIYIPLPFTPVPITLQTLFVLLAGMILGKDGALSQLSYLLMGSLGVPIFAVAGSGILSVTTGYLLGFVLAAWIVGKFFHKMISLLGEFFILAVADGLILLMGSIWLSLFIKLDIIKAFQLGAVPFILGDVLKIFLAISVYKIYKLIRAEDR